MNKPFHSLFFGALILAGGVIDRDAKAEISGFACLNEENVMIQDYSVCEGRDGRYVEGVFSICGWSPDSIRGKEYKSKREAEAAAKADCKSHGGVKVRYAGQQIEEL